MIIDVRPHGGRIVARAWPSHEPPAGADVMQLGETDHDPHTPTAARIADTLRRIADGIDPATADTP